MSYVAHMYHLLIPVKDTCRDNLINSILDSLEYCCLHLGHNIGNYLPSPQQKPWEIYIIIMSSTTPWHNHKNINNNGLLRLESLKVLNKINNIIMFWTTPCHNENTTNNFCSLRLESLNNPNK